MSRRQRMLLQLLGFAALLAAAHCQCPTGWREYDTSCYLFSNDTKSWMEANAFCLEQSSNLMSIHNIQERLWVRTQISTEVYWIGLTDQFSENNWEWSDGSDFIHYISYWIHGQPDNFGGGEDCGQVVGSNFGQWSDEDCSIKKKYICKYINSNPTPHCDLSDGWKQHESNCYKLKSETRKSWSEARHDCVLEGGDLVSISSREEEDYITSAMDPSHLDLWIGFSTLKCNKISCEVEAGNTKFSWSDALESDYTNWATAPTVDAQGGSCAAKIKDASDTYGKWKSHLCRYERPYMCKRPLNTICPEGWLSFSGSCYWLVSNINLLTTWHEALTQCSSIGAHLLIINSEEEQFFINGYLPDFHQVNIPDLWIGLSDKDQDGSFRWVDKTAVEFSNYGSGFPQNTVDRWDCGQIFTGNYDGKWETTDCYKKMGYVCEMTGGQNPKPTSAPDSHCDAGYLLYGDFCYRFETETVKKWEDAEAQCVKEQAHLVSFHSEEELSFITAHMPGESWVGLNDIKVENTFEYTDGTPFDLDPWGQNQPDNSHDNVDCVHLRGMDQHEPGKLSADFCTVTKEYICKKAKGEGPPPQPPTTGPGWNTKCGSWTADPYNDYCYLFNFLSMRTWAEARDDCVNQGGNLVSIGDPYEQAFIQGVLQQSPTGISLWMGAHDSYTEGGWEWSDGSPFRFIHWAAGSPGDQDGEDCLSILINGGYWDDDVCEQKRGYICKRRGKTPEPPPPHDGFLPALVCQGSTAVLHCPEESVINIQSAFYGRKDDDICPHLDTSGGSCTVDNILPHYRKVCDNRQFCFAYAHVEVDPCPAVSKYLEIIYSCEQKVCLHGLGVEDGNVTDSQLSASSSSGSFTPNKARLNGASCWMPSGSATSSWIQVNLGEQKKVTGIVLQGCPQSDNWVTKYKVQHSADGSTWTDYTADGEYFLGSADKNTPETQLLGTPVSAQYVRLIPLEFNGQIGLRFDVLGCTPDYAITCDEKGSFTSDTDKMTVHCPSGCAHASYTVYGTTEYRGDSNICAAAIHAGVVRHSGGGDVTLMKTAGLDFYAGSTRNGITSRQYDGHFDTSFTFADGELRCSGPDWYEFGDYCYKPFEKKMWHEAQESCRSLGAELLSIRSMTEQSWVESYLFLATSDVWTGLNDLAFPGMFIWSDGHMVTFTYWTPGEPSNHDGYCVEMLHETGRWSTVSCSELNTFICKMPKAHYPAPSVEPTQYGCPQGWDAYAYGCYWMEETPRSWEEAKEFCDKEDSFLVHVGDIYEQSHFTVYLSGKTGFWWTGLRAHGSIIGGGVDYIWDNGLPLDFTHWDKDQPDSGDGNCVAMTAGQGGGFWDDKPCSETHNFICEKHRSDISPPTQAPTPPPSQGCAEGWTALAHFRYCFRLFHNVDWSQKKSWEGAREDCVSRGGDLASIHSQEEESFLALYSKGSSKWIGLKHNAVEGGYSWSDGTPLSHTNWGPEEPNNHEGREECVEMVSTTNGSYSWWNDLNCDAHQDWICEISKGQTPILPPVPPSPVPAPDCGANPGWRKNDGVCYYYNDTDIVDFHTAMIRCYEESAALVTIHSKEEQAFVNSMVGTGKVAAAWIGMLMLGAADGKYYWVDLSPVSYVHWAEGEPNNANGEEQCVQMNRNQGGWNDANCGRASAGYVCKKLPGDVHTVPPPTQPWEGNCPAGWLRFNNKCFLFKGKKDEQKANWSSARSWCKEQGGELAVIDNQHENDFVASYLRDLQLPAWIGLSDLVEEDQYGWSDGSQVLYTNWKEKEPDNADGVEDCVAVSHNYLVSGRWTDDACHKEHSFVCYRKKSSEIDPPPPTKSPCPDGYISWYQNCYKLVEEAATWDAAQAACEQQGGNLASIDMSYDQAFVSGVVLHGHAEAWIGLRRQGDSYKWTDGWPVFFTHWGPGEPTTHEDEGCVSMTPHIFIQGTWNDTKCSDAKPYICKTSTENPPPTPAPGSGKCLPGWAAYGHYCYIVYNGAQGFSWPDARHYCQSVWGELASIHSRAEVEFIRNLNYSENHNLWIGLTRDSNFGWAWTDKTPLGFLNWAHGEPSSNLHEITGEYCGEMYPDGLWNDNDCFQKRGFVCRHRQYHTTDDGGKPVFPTDAPSGSNAGVIAGAVIAAILIVVLLAGLLYYVFAIRGFKLSLPRRSPSPAVDRNYDNPNFRGDS